MAKEDWDILQGYPELEVFSWHLDSLILYMAHYADIQQSLLPYPVYHIEHAGGWTPEQASKLWRWVKSKDIPYLTNEDLAEAEQKMRYSDKPIKYNKETWGTTDVELPETIPHLYTSPNESRDDMRQAA